MKADGSRAAKGMTHVDWASFAAAWRAGYGPAMDRVRQGDLPWTHIDGLHRLILDRLLVEFRIGGLSADEKEHFNRAWHRLGPWPDAVPGLHRLKTRYIIATLSNGNVALLTNMAKRAGLPWDCILSAELFRRYKPDAAVYTGAARVAGPAAGTGDDGGGAQRRSAGRPRRGGCGPRSCRGRKNSGQASRWIPRRSRGLTCRPATS